MFDFVLFSPTLSSNWTYYVRMGAVCSNTAPPSAIPTDNPSKTPNYVPTNEPTTPTSIPSNSPTLTIGM